MHSRKTSTVGPIAQYYKEYMQNTHLMIRDGSIMISYRQRLLEWCSTAHQNINKNGYFAPDCTRDEIGSCGGVYQSEIIHDYPTTK